MNEEVGESVGREKEEERKREKERKRERERDVQREMECIEDALLSTLEQRISSLFNHTLVGITRRRLVGERGFFCALNKTIVFAAKCIIDAFHGESAWTHLSVNCCVCHTRIYHNFFLGGGGLEKQAEDLSFR